MSEQKIKDNHRILTSDILVKTANEYHNHDYPNRPFTLTGFNIPNNSYAHPQPEKRLQWLVQKQIELLTNKPIPEETKDTPVNSETGGFILEDILLDKIKLLNENTINNFKDKHKIQLSFNNIAKKICQDFIKRFKLIIDSNDYNKNIELHKLFFNDNKILSLKIEGHALDYIVIDTNRSNNNTINIIKEKKLKRDASFEYADFAVYYNGLPFIVIEMKQFMVNGEQGYRKANEDYKRKTTYHNFLACIGTDTKKTFISSNPKLSDPFIWQNYKDLDGYVSYYNSDDRNGLFDVIKELLISENNMLFYFEICTMKSEDGQYLKNARIQQYMTAKKIYDKMARNLDTKEGFKNYFQHHTRTGKSFTFKIIAYMAFKKFNEKYNKCIFFTHDIASVMPSVKKEFQGLEFPAGPIKQIQKKRDYKSILKSNNIFCMYIANMQIIDKTNKAIDDSDNVLIFIDEVHTHQKSAQGTQQDKTMADFRDIHFPNATIISATATPLKKEYKNSKGEIVSYDMTAELYGECVDKVTPSDAIDLNLVTKLNYHKIDYEDKSFKKILAQYKNQEYKEQQAIIDECMSHIDTLIEQNKESILHQSKIRSDVLQAYNYIVINKDNYETIEQTNNFVKDSEEYNQMHILLTTLQEVVNTDIKKISAETRHHVKQSIWQRVLPEKINAIVVPEIIRQRDNIEESNAQYMPKFFYVVEGRHDQANKTNGEIMLDIIKSLIQEHINKNPDCDKTQFDIQNNVYYGVRFAFDSSDSDNLDKTNNYNGDLGNKNNITELFEADEYQHTNHWTKPVDVLILVRKKLMGYDNKNLTTVFLDREIDISNIKEMLQLATRGTTKRQDKEAGYIIDLTFNERNIQTFNKAFSVYDEKADIKEFLFDDKQIDKTIEILKNEKEQLMDLFIKQKEFKNNSKEELFKNPVFSNIVEYIKEQYWQWATKNNNSYFIEHYIDKVSNIEKTYKALVSPKFMLERKDEVSLLNDVLSIFQINAYLLQDIKNKERKVYKRKYTSEDIVGILEQTFSSFGGLDGFLSQINIRSKKDRGREIVVAENYQKTDKKSKMRSSITTIQKEINKIGNPFKSLIAQELENISLAIDSTNTSSITSEQQQELDKLRKKVEQQKQQEQYQANTYFNGNRPKYKIVHNLDSEFGKLNYEALLVYADKLDKLIRQEVKRLDLTWAAQDKIDFLLSEVNFCYIEDFNNNEIELIRPVYNSIFDASKGFLNVEEANLKQDFKEGLNYEDIDDNKILNILLEYIDE